MGRALGRMTGRATGLLYRARAQLFDFAEKTELTKVQQELQATMYQLNAIRSELQGGINILDPGPLTRRVFMDGGSSTPSGSSSSSILGGNQQQQRSSNGEPSTSPPPPISNSFRDMRNSSGGGGEGLGFPSAAASAAASTAAAAPTTPAGLQSSQSKPTAAVQPVDLPRTPPPLLRSSETSTTPTTTMSTTVPFQVLPISAQSAGLVPDRTATAPTGSEILLDALQEEKVARQAQAFFKQAS